MTDGMQFLENAQRWKQRREAGETQAAIAKDEGCAASYISGAVKVLDLPDRYHKMLRADKMQIEAAMKFAKIPTALQEPGLDLAIQFRKLGDAISDHQAQLEPTRKSTKIRRSPKGKLRIDEATSVVSFLKEKGVEVRSW